jgi:hypothetical protein
MNMQQRIESQRSRAMATGEEGFFKVQTDAEGGATDLKAAKRRRSSDEAKVRKSWCLLFLKQPGLGHFIGLNVG